MVLGMRGGVERTDEVKFTAKKGSESVAEPRWKPMWINWFCAANGSADWGSGGEALRLSETSRQQSGFDQGRRAFF